MIFVTVGTHDKPFKRLLVEIQRLIDKGIIKDKVIVQAGSTKFESKDMTILDLIPMDEFNKYISECDLLITHGGVGSITDALKKNKKVIAVPRMVEYNEVVNDHQMQIIENFSKVGYIIGTRDVSEIEDALKKVKKFKPKKFISNTDNFIKLIEEKINE